MTTAKEAVENFRKFSEAYYAEIVKETPNFVRSVKNLFRDPRMRMMLEIAADAAEKQIPKKPKENDRLVCPNCNSKAKYGHPYENYCCHCGQALDWKVSEDEK